MGISQLVVLKTKMTCPVNWRYGQDLLNY